MERPEIYTDNYNSLEEWIELRKRNEEFVYPQFFVPFREWMKDIEQKSDMEIKELLRILLQPYTLGVDTVDTYEFYKEYVQDKVNKEKNLQTYELCMNQLKYNERIYRIKNKQEAWEGLTWVLPLLNINPMKALKALGMYFDAECIYILWRYLLIKMMVRYYMQNTLIMRLLWMRFIIIMVRIGILVKMSRVMCIRDIITISQEIQKVALL